MNNAFLKAIVNSGIATEVIAAVEAVSANRSVATPAVLIAFVGYVEPNVATTNLVRNTNILAMLAHYPLNTINTRSV